jgi:glycerophosphoryl diester phosphodiesterase
MSDTIAAVRLTIPQQVRNKKVQKEGFKCPDIILFQPNNKYHGLFIEVKIETPFKKDGSIKASQDDHLLKQYRTIQDLIAKGYYASFAWTFEMAKEIIDNYLNNKL